MELFLLEPEKKNNPLAGREYEFGTSDCFEAARDYYGSIGIELPSRDMYEMIGGLRDWIILQKNT